jgi:hypothetical protein
MVPAPIPRVAPAEAEDFSSSLEKRLMDLSQDAQSVKPADDTAASFIGANDEDLAKSLNERVSASESMSSDADVDFDLQADVDPNAPLTRALPYTFKR